MHCNILAFEQCNLRFFPNLDVDHLKRPRQHNMSLKALDEQTKAFLADQNDATRETLASNLAGVVQTCDFHSALPEELLANLTSLLYATLQKEIPTVSQTAQLLQDAFAALPKSTDLDLDEPANPSATGERVPQSVVEVLQTAILDACWTCDATFEATGESWPPAKDTQSPARFKLRELLASLLVCLDHQTYE